jgi:hypothetical protein
MSETIVAQSNTPRLDLDAALAPDKLQAYLDYEYAEHKSQEAGFLAMHARFLAATPDGIQSDDVLTRAGDAVRQIADELKALDKTHERIKKPVLIAQRTIDGGKKSIVDSLNGVVNSIAARQNAYLTLRAERIRKQSEAEAAAKELEAQRLMAEASLNAEPETIEAAVQVYAEAEQAAQVATASTLELSRTRSASGTLISQRDNWEYEVVDLSKVPRYLLLIDVAAVKLAIKRGARQIDGLRIYNAPKVSNR